jgi:hypothetical protein
VNEIKHERLNRWRFALWFSLMGLLAAPTGAQAVPAYARQTGQSCVACHAGGQFPELTAYGRAFKLTGYTYGTHTLPVSVMASWGYTSISNTSSPNSDSSMFPKNNSGIYGLSVFLAGKITDHIGAFFQWTYDPYASQSASGAWQSDFVSDNIDFRAADRWLSGKTDLIYGLTVNNNPTVQDVWNSTPAFAFPYMTSPFMVEQTVGGTLLEGGLGQQAAGVGAYAYWNKKVYAEFSGYQTADGPWSFMSQGVSSADQIQLKGIAPYWRVALTHEWGPHSAMIGTYGLIADIYPDSLIPSGPTDHYRDIAFDAQYQYILDPHTITAQLNYITERIDWNSTSVANGDVSNPSDNVYSFRAKGSYFYRNKYGGSLQYFNLHGTTDPVLYSSTDPVTGNLAGSPDTRGWVAELDWMPIQYVRLGVQYWWYSAFNGSSSNYDGNGRSAGNNNTLFVYLWGAI